MHQVNNYDRSRADRHQSKQTARRAQQGNEEYTQMMMVVAGPNPVPRVKQIFSQCLRNSRSKAHLCAQIVKASEGLYKPRGFNEPRSAKEVKIRTLVKAAAGPRLLNACRDMGMLRSSETKKKSGQPIKQRDRFRTCLRGLDRSTLAKKLGVHGTSRNLA